jgi:hypothetical protein
MKAFGIPRILSYKNWFSILPESAPGSPGFAAPRPLHFLAISGDPRMNFQVIAGRMLRSGELFWS